jgi:hypothetical protein
LRYLLPPAAELFVFRREITCPYQFTFKSNISLYLDQGATIIAAEPSKDAKYDPPPEPNPWEAYQDFAHSLWHNSLI